MSEYTNIYSNLELNRHLTKNTNYKLNQSIKQLIRIECYKMEFNKLRTIIDYAFICISDENIFNNIISTNLNNNDECNDKIYKCIFDSEIQVPNIRTSISLSPKKQTLLDMYFTISNHNYSVLYNIINHIDTIELIDLKTDLLFSKDIGGNTLDNILHKRNITHIAGNDGDIAGNDGDIAGNDGDIAGNDGDIAGNERVKLLSVEQIKNITINNEYTTEINKDHRSNITFYKLSEDDIKYVENIIDINIGDIIVKKKFIQITDDTTEKLGGMNGPYHRECKSLMRLHNKKHFPTILYCNDATKVVYMTYCGKPLCKKSGNIPIDWKEHITEMIITLSEMKIYNNDMWLNNLLVKDGILYMIDFGWATFDNDNYPFINITENDLLENDSLLDLLSIVYSRVAAERILFTKENL